MKLNWPDLKFPAINLLTYPRGTNMTLPIQKVLHLSEAKKKKSFTFSRNYAILPKLDGWYVYVDCIEGIWGQLCSSAGREIPSLTYLSAKLKKLSSPSRNLRFIFEATIPNKLFHELNGILNRKYEPAEGVVLNLHDVVAIDEPTTPFYARYEKCKVYKDVFQQVFEQQVSLIPVLEISKEEPVFYNHFGDIITAGGEGVILKDIDSGYHFGKRNDSMLKIKEEVTKDLVVVGMVAGEGKYSDTLGALRVKSKNGLVHTISGMTDGQRELWWSRPELSVGKIVEVKAMKELPDGSLREPRFKCIREDKTIGDID
jgi:DNA ligase-1